MWDTCRQVSHATPFWMEPPLSRDVSRALALADILLVPHGYTTVELLYQGASKAVARAQRTQDKKSVIFKFLLRNTPQGLEGLRREVSFLKQLHGTGVSSSKRFLTHTMNRNMSICD